jgi:nucleolar protein 58
VAVADPKLSNSIAQLPGLSLKTVSDSSTQDVFRAIRENLTSLLPDLLPSEEAATRLGLAHSLSRHKLRFSPDKVDTMIIQSIASLDVLDKQLNTYAMRVKEWYGWHFPELAKSMFQPFERRPPHKYVTDYNDSSQRQPRLLSCRPQDGFPNQGA